MVRSISEMLEELSNISSRKDKIRYLKTHSNNKAFMTVLKYTFDPKIEFALPEGVPPYTPCDIIDQHNMLIHQARKLYLFTKKGSPNVHPLKRETLFVQLLESIDPNDAKLVLSMKDKKMPYKGVTSKLINEAFPGFLDA